ncbi:hypothetical protein N9117_02525 [Akkermansiaceae bacterium]|nr:hypothetical protein [Akkermansiaceae bacterium]
MSGWKKLAAASAAGGGGLDVDDVFSTYLYTGNGSSQTITNGIDLAGEGGMVWVKNRNSNTIGGIGDTERGTYSLLAPSETFSPLTGTTANFTAFNSDGFGVGTGNYTLVNYSGHNYASWTFRKAPKFFDVVTYTGTGSTRTISHNLGSEPGMIIVKRTSGSEAGGTAGWWVCYHRGLSTPQSAAIFLNSTDSRNAAGLWNNTAPTSTEFTVDNAYVNYSGDTYVAYLFAHNDGDGEFGPNSDQDIIKCGNYSGNGNGEYDDNGTEVNLGFEPQWVLIKSSTWYNGNWMMFDTMRGITTRPSPYSRDGDDAVLYANQSYAEAGNSNFLRVTPTGFKLETDNYDVNGSPHDYIYIAIRRGPIAVPESATDVFSVTTGSGTGVPMFNAGHVTDFSLRSFGYTSVHDNSFAARLFGNRYWNNESSSSFTDSNMKWDYMNGFYSQNSDQPTRLTWNFKRAPGFMDVVAWNPNGTSGYVDLDHNLGVAPEAILETRVASSGKTFSFQTLANTSISEWAQIPFNQPDAKQNAALYSNVTDTSFRMYSSNDNKAYFLFASLAGISKVGKFTAPSSGSINIDCGFSSGARFVLLKSTQAGYNWHVYDSVVQGIVAGNDPYIRFNTTQAQVTSEDRIDPYSAGFTANVGGEIPAGHEIVYIAIA